MHYHSFISSTSNTSPGSSSSSQGSLSPASSLSPALSIRQGKHHHHNRRRRPSPLKRQMSLGNGGPESSPAAGQPALDIDPRRSHAAGPLAVLYSVEPHEDPLLNPSPARSPSKNSLRGSIHSSPINELSAADPPHGTPRSVSALAALERAAPPASPNRSLLSAFQAVSPRLQNVPSRSTSAPSLSHLQGYTSPRGPAPQSLAPASPISTSPRQPTARTSYATAAFRALNGASPQKQVPSRSSSSSSVPSTSAANVSPVRSRSSSALRQVFNDAPSWQIYRDADGPAQNMTHRSSTTRPAQTAARHVAEEGAFALDEDLPDEEDYQNENDENSAPPPIADAAVPPQHRVLTQNFAEQGSRLGTLNGSGHRRSSLSMSSLPLNIDRDRNVTPPPSDSRWREALNGGQSPNDLLQEHEEASPHALASAQRARKRLRTSAEISGPV